MKTNKVTRSTDQFVIENPEYGKSLCIGGRNREAYTFNSFMMYEYTNDDKVKIAVNTGQTLVLPRVMFEEKILPHFHTI